jgi:cytochrome c oxidase assembly protein subunit 15
MVFEAQQRNNKQIAFWLLVCCLLVFSMVVLGGVTRLTRSGLSMVEWDPIMGIVPPMNEAEWQTAFDKYKQFPEYQKINAHMDLAGFKSIFLVEYAHRVLGRTIGLAFLLPFLFFWVTRKISRELVPKLVLMFVLGGLQGLLGWYMVKSGLVDRPHVSQYRLTAHLLAAFAIYGYMLWVALALLRPRAANAGVDNIISLRRMGWLVTAFLLLVITSGGFVAGTKAGFAFNSFPLMNGQWLPPGYWALQPGWLNLFDNIATVQFNHRWLAITLAVVVCGYWWKSRRYPLDHSARGAFMLLLLVLGAQIALGISTLLMVVPVKLGAAHQGGALLLFSAALYVNHTLRAR